MCRPNVFHAQGGQSGFRLLEGFCRIGAVLDRFCGLAVSWWNGKTDNFRFRLHPQPSQRPEAALCQASVFGAACTP
jgi:hypothetical protein